MICARFISLLLDTELLRNKTALLSALAHKQSSMADLFSSSFHRPARWNDIHVLLRYSIAKNKTSSENIVTPKKIWFCYSTSDDLVKRVEGDEAYLGCNLTQFYQPNKSRANRKETRVVLLTISSSIQLRWASFFAFFGELSRLARISLSALRPCRAFIPAMMLLSLKEANNTQPSFSPLSTSYPQDLCQ